MAEHGLDIAYETISDGCSSLNPVAARAHWRRRPRPAGDDGQAGLLRGASQSAVRPADTGSTPAAKPTQCLWTTGHKGRTQGLSRQAPSHCQTREFGKGWSNPPLSANTALRD